MSFQRSAQVVSLSIFLILLFLLFFDLVIIGSTDIFLRLDPVLVFGSAVAGRLFLWAFVPAIIVLVSALVAGRIFCGYVCPMGTTIDGADRLIGSRKRKKDTVSLRLKKVKYYLLAFIFGAGVLGVSLVFVASPLSLITRFYGLVISPVLAFLGDGALVLFRPVADRLDWRSVVYADIGTVRFNTILFIFFFFVLVFLAARLAPRFWCRYLCPSGAMLALFSKRPLIRRKVNDSCTACGKCARKCPMEAISLEEPEKTEFGECLVCRTCARVCPESAVEFSVLPPKNAASANEEPSPGRRRFLTAGVLGAGAGIVLLSGLYAPGKEKGQEGKVLASGLIRPPGSLPEFEFLSRCVRCGECMAACPTNTLQPVWFRAGLMGLFSPAIMPERAYCDPHCTNCGRVCPTGAIRDLSPGERIWAKTGTAMVLRGKCLAWEHHKSCMVCDEVCPYDAIDFRREKGISVPVPHVIEDRCAGCGYCEYHCPIENRAAIVVIAMGALRIADGSYAKEGKSRGLNLDLKDKKGAYSYPSGEAAGKGTAPGFDSGKQSQAAPGFDSGKSKQTAPGFDE